MFYFTSAAVATFMEMKVHLPKSCVHVCPMAQTAEALVAATVDSQWVRESIGGALTCHPEPFQCSIRIWVGGKLPRGPAFVESPTAQTLDGPALVTLTSSEPPADRVGPRLH